MANLAKGYTFGATESVTNAKLHSLVDSATITGIVNADIAAGAAIDFSKIAQTDIDGSKLTGLANIVSGAGVIPIANIPSSSIVPSGVIVMWSGTIVTIPSGWYLCNGSNGTPDLRNKFIVCADADDGGTAKSTISGSAAQSGGSTTITAGNLPAHVHTVDTVVDYGGAPGNRVAATSQAATSTLNTSSIGSGSAYTQPYYALAYIMKA